MFDAERLCMGCMNVKGEEKNCPVCNFDSSLKNPTDTLPMKFIINNRFLVGKVIGIDGEGISYIGFDMQEEQVVNIKEYMPINFAHRNPDKTIAMVSGGEYTFNEGLLEFKEINSHIKDSELPALTKVIDVFEENGTIYSVTEQLSGITLEQFLEKNGGSLKWEQARALFLPLFDTVKGMNDLGVVHGGISTKTIFVCRDGKLRISDYKIKKMRNSGSQMQSQLFDGFAAAEQYNIEGLNCGAYTDVYALSATIFSVIIGVVPPSAFERINNDAMTIPTKFAEELPHHVLSALANGLQVFPKDRTKDIDTLKNELVYGEIREAVVKKDNKQTENANKKVNKRKGSTLKYLVISALCTALVFIGIAAILVFGVFKDELFDNSSSERPVSDNQVSAPVVDQIGDIESGAEVTTKLYDVPDLKGKYYSDIIEDKELEKFEIVISSKKFCNDHSRGTVCEQSVAPGTAVAKRGTKIELVISLGPKEIKIANLKGLTEDAAKLELLKQGFLYNNIDVEEKYDADREPGVVIDQSPKYGTSVSTDISVKIYINAYKGEEYSSNVGNLD